MTPDNRFGGIMANMALAYTSSGVESVALIDQDALDSLSTWLCSEKEYHYPIEKMRESKDNGIPRKIGDTEFDRQQKTNGGYCNLCKDFAGEILSHFELVRKVH